MKILHVMRAPVGGLFRHVVDLARGQSARGHEVGVILDSLTGNTLSESMLADLTPQLKLGLTRTAIPRQPGPGDLPALAHVARRLWQTGADVVHGHGAKGGALARLVTGIGPALRVYTPHGGSLHDGPGSRLHTMMEKLLKPRSHLCLFESAFSHDVYRRKVGEPSGMARVVHNGVRPEELEPVTLVGAPTDIVYIGEMRDLKGVDVLIDALAALAFEGTPMTATLVGDGPQIDEYRHRVAERGLEALVTFTGPLPARVAFTRGRMVVLPSRAESLPYVVLEAAAAGKALVATRVGGIAEIFGPMAEALITPDSVSALVNALHGMAEAEARIAPLRARIVEGFSVDSMVDSVLASYRQALAARAGQPVGAKRSSPQAS